METAALVGFFGLAGVLLGGWLQQHFASRESERLFDRQRQLAREDHERQAAYEVGRELSLRLDEYLLWSDGLVGLLQYLLLNNLTIDDIEERNRVYGLVRKKLGIEDAQRFVTPDLFEEDELRALLTEHWKIGIDLENQVCLVQGPLPDRQVLNERWQRMADLRSKIDIKRRELLRAARPL